MTDFVVRAIDAAATRPLRHSVLRPSQPPETLVYPGDDHVLALHVGAFDPAGELVCVASVTPGDLPEKFAQPGDDRRAPWQLRGMATRPDVRGQGVGGAVLKAIIGHAAAHAGSVLWCNGRIPAVDFYLRHGFIRRGEEYVLPVTGAHYFLTRVLAATDVDLQLT